VIAFKQTEIDFNAPAYPDVAGHQSGSGTSEEAARSMDGELKGLRAECYHALGCADRGFTADEVAIVVGRTVLAIRPRITELRRLGLIFDTGERRVNISGRRAAVWKAWGA